MAVVGIQALSYRNSSGNIFMFLSKSPEFQCHLKQDKQQLRPSHIISVNYLDLDQAYATHEFQVQSKYQSSFIQKSEEFKAKNQVLEINYSRATIHHFHIQKLFRVSFIYYQILKESKANYIHTLFIQFSLFKLLLLLQINIYFAFSFAFFS